MEAGNAYLPEFGDDYNRRFACEPQSAHDAHRPLLENESLARTFTVQENRKVSTNMTLHYNRVMYLLDPSELADSTRGKHVQVHEHEDGAVRIYAGNVELRARPFPKDSRVSQGAIVSNKLLAGALTVIQAQQQERDQRALQERGMTRRERAHFQDAMQEAWSDPPRSVRDPGHANARRRFPRCRRATRAGCALGLNPLGLTPPLGSLRPPHHPPKASAGDSTAAPSNQQALWTVPSLGTAQLPPSLLDNAALPTLTTADEH